MRTVRPGSSFNLVEEEAGSRISFVQEVEEAFRNLSALVNETKNTTTVASHNISKEAAAVADRMASNVSSLAETVGATWHQTIADMATQAAGGSVAQKVLAVLIFLCIFGLAYFASQYWQSSVDAEEAEEGERLGGKRLVPPGPGAPPARQKRAQPALPLARGDGGGSPSAGAGGGGTSPSRRRLDAPQSDPAGLLGVVGAGPEAPMPAQGDSGDAAAGGMPMAVPAAVAAAQARASSAAAAAEGPASEEEGEAEQSRLRSRESTDSQGSEEFDINGGDRRYSKITKTQARRVIQSARAAKAEGEAAQGAGAGEGQGPGAGAEQ